MSINQPIATALVEKVYAMLTAEYLTARAARADGARFEAVLDKVRARGAPPVAGDEMDGRNHVG